MKSQVFIGETRHCRLRPERHSFRYGMFWLAIDLSELESLRRAFWILRYDRPAPTSLRDDDYAGSGDGSLRDRITALVGRHGLSPARITLLTVPRVLGYVFNPVSFYIGEEEHGRVIGLVAEVRNTFGEVHHYVMKPEGGPDASGRLRFICSKQFYVSPFLDVDGRYELLLDYGADRFRIDVRLRQGEELVFWADMQGRGTPLSERSMLAALARFPLYAATVMLRIHWHALRLYVGKRMPMYSRDRHGSGAATRRSFWHHMRERVVSRARKPQSRPGKVNQLVTLENE